MMLGESRWTTGLRDRIGLLAIGATLLLLSAPSSAQTQAAGSGLPLHRKSEESLREVSRQINNPISTLWQLTFDNQIVGQDGGGLETDEPGYTGTFQPVMPINLSKFGLGHFEWAEDFNVITRLSVPFVETTPLPPESGSGERDSGFGDIQLASVLAPNNTYGFVWGSARPSSSALRRTTNWARGNGRRVQRPSRAIWGSGGPPMPSLSNGGRSQATTIAPTRVSSA
jgi:hypothetical protein